MGLTWNGRPERRYRWRRLTGEAQAFATTGYDLVDMPSAAIHGVS